MLSGLISPRLRSPASIVACRVNNPQCVPRRIIYYYIEQTYLHRFKIKILYIESLFWNKTSDFYIHEIQFKWSKIIDEKMKFLRAISKELDTESVHKYFFAFWNNLFWFSRTIPFFEVFFQFVIFKNSKLWIKIELLAEANKLWENSRDFVKCCDISMEIYSFCIGTNDTLFDFYLDPFETYKNVEKKVAFFNSLHASNLFRSILPTLIFSNLVSRHDSLDNNSPISGQTLPLLRAGAQLRSERILMNLKFKEFA